MKIVCQGPDTVNGIDIYHGDPINDIQAVITSGIRFVSLKAWEYHQDPKFNTRWPAMKKAGLIRGAYDFFHPTNDPLAQANNFLKLVGPLDATDLPMMLDWESSEGMPSSKDKQAALLWLNRVEEVTKKIPIIYGSSYFLDALQLDHQFKKYGLWVAEYGVSCPKVPAPWDTWNFWQNSEGEQVPGMAVPTDTDIFNGTLADLKKFILDSHVK